MNVDDLAKAKGLKSYDTALPQDWVDDVEAVTGEYVAARGLFVWCYDQARIGGRAEPLTPEAETILARYQATKAESAR